MELLIKGTSPRVPPFSLSVCQLEKNKEWNYNSMDSIMAYFPVPMIQLNRRATKEKAKVSMLQSLPLLGSTSVNVIARNLGFSMPRPLCKCPQAHEFLWRVPSSPSLIFDDLCRDIQICRDISAIFCHVESRQDSCPSLCAGTSGHGCVGPGDDDALHWPRGPLPDEELPRNGKIWPHSLLQIEGPGRKEDGYAEQLQWTQDELLHWNSSCGERLYGNFALHGDTSPRSVSQ